MGWLGLHLDGLRPPARLSPDGKGNQNRGGPGGLFPGPLRVPLTQHQGNRAPGRPTSVTARRLTVSAWTCCPQKIAIGPWPIPRSRSLMSGHGGPGHSGESAGDGCVIQHSMSPWPGVRAELGDGKPRPSSAGARGTSAARHSRIFRCRDPISQECDGRGDFVRLTGTGHSNCGGDLAGVRAILVQDGCSPLTAQNLHSCDIDPGRFEFPGDSGDLRLISQEAYHVVDGPVVEMVDVDLGLVHVAPPSCGGCLHRPPQYP